MQAVARIHQILSTWARRLGPYVVLEILLPGGTLFALLLFLYRRSRQVSAVARPAAAATYIVLSQKMPAMSNG